MESYTGKDYGPKAGMIYTQVEPSPGFKYVYDQDGRRYSVPDGSQPVSGDSAISPISKIPTDQEIRDKGFKFIPDQKYLKSPFMLPVDEEPVADKGIVATNSFNDNEPFYSTTTNTGGLESIATSPFTNKSFSTEMFETGPFANPYGKTLEDYNRNPYMDPLNQKIVEKLREDRNLDATYSDEELIDMFGNQNFKENEEEFSLTDYLPFVGDKSLFQGIMGAFPQPDSRATNIRQFYGGQDNLDSIGRIKSGLMAGYNPVSGSDFLHGITGGLLPAKSYGLQRAYQKRIDTINKTLARKYADGNYDDTQLDERLAELEAAKAAELQQIQRGQREKDYNTIQDAYQNQTGGGSSYSGGESKKGDDTSYNDPFDPGGGE